MFRCFQPLLFGVAHAGWIVQILAGAQTNEVFVCIGMIFFHKMHIVRGDEFGIGLAGESNQLLILKFLFDIRLCIGSRFVGFVALQFEVIIVAKNFFVPQYGSFGSSQIAGFNVFVNFATQAGRCGYQSLAVLCQQVVVNARAVIKSLNPTV